MEFKRILAIGDIHGQWEKFMSLYEKIHFSPEEDLLIFLGDYVDRGPKSLYVLDWMYEHRNEKNMIMLRGNHEDMMLNYLKDGDNLWIWNGGQKLSKSLKHQNSAALNKCVDFLEKLPLYYRTQYNGREIIFCHAGILQNIPMEDQDKRELLWIRDEFFETYDQNALVVIGHTPTPYLNLPPEPIYCRSRRIIMADTGAFMEGGRLSCVDIPSGTFMQDDSDEVRMIKDANF